MNFLRKLLLRSNFKIILTAFNNGKNNQIHYDFFLIRHVYNSLNKRKV